MMPTITRVTVRVKDQVPAGGLRVGYFFLRAVLFLP